MMRHAIRDVSAIIRDQRPLTLPPETKVIEACQWMHDRGVGAVLVTDRHGRLLGIFTGRDAVGRVLAAGLDAAKVTLAEVMTPDPDHISPGCDAVAALHRMCDGGFRHLPIVAGDRVVGIVSRGDFRGLEHATFDEQAGLWERL